VVIRIPVIVPVRPVIVENISVLHVLRRAMWVISRVERRAVMVMANLTPRTSFWLGGISIVCFPLPCLIETFFVNAFLIGSVVVFHLLLSCAFWEGSSSAFQEGV